MINDIITGITGKLYDVFGKNYKIYAEDVKQGLKEPCFLISHLATSAELLLATRKKLNNAFCITFIPAEGNAVNKGLNDVQFKLIANMEFITTIGGESYRGTGMRTETLDNVLHFFVNYNCIVNEVKEKDLMETMEFKEVGVYGNN